MSASRRRSWRLAVVGLSLLVCLASVAVASPAFAASTSVDRILVKAGESLTLSATGLSANESVVSWVSSARGSVYATAGGQANSSGNITLGIQLGRFWEPGWWAVTVHGLSSKREAITTFEVTPSPPDGALDVDTTTVHRGNRINFHGTGFSDSEAISVWVTLPDGSAVSVSTSLHSVSQAIYFSYDVPANAPAGTWSMTAYGQSGGRFLIRTFVVAP